MFISTMLREAENDKGGAGGAVEGETPETEPPKYMTIEEFNKSFTQRLQAPLDAFKKQFLTSITGTITETIKAAMPEIDAAVDAKIAAITPAHEDKNKRPPPNVADDPLVRGMRQELTDAKNQIKAAQEATALERAKVRDRDLRQRVSDALGDAGVKDPARNRAAVTNLIANKQVSWSDSDEEQINFASDDGAVDLKTGIKGWSKTDDAKIFIAPTNTRGSGDLGGGAKSPSGGVQPYQRGAFGQALAATAGGMELVIGPGKVATKAG
jgi:hypothetical protein